MALPGTLYLIPTTLGERAPEAVIPVGVLEKIRGLGHFIAENPKSARAFLKIVGVDRPLQSIVVDRLDHNTPESAIDDLLAPLVSGHDVGVISEAGCPAIADPGAPLVRRAHERGIRVTPLVGPSSILLALIASGLESQRFAFLGYLPAKPHDRERAIRDIESRSARRRETQIFIETPYRNAVMLDSLIATCRGSSLLCIATDLTLETESVRTQPVADWAKDRPDVKDKPSVFLLLADS